MSQINPQKETQLTALQNSKSGNRAGQTALQGPGAGHASQFLSVSLGCLQMICCVTFDKSYRIPGLSSLVPFTFVMILLMQNEHEAPAGFGEGGTGTDSGSDQPVLDLSQPLQMYWEPWASPMFCISALRRKPMKWKGKQTDGDAALHLPFPQRFAHANKNQEAGRFACENE